VRTVVVALALAACAPPQPPRTPGKRTIVLHSVGTNFVPFGAGQFQNGEPVKGAVLATGESVTMTASASVFVYLMAKYGLSARIPDTDAGRVRVLQQIEIGTGLAFFGLYAYGVLDGLAHYRPFRELDVTPAPGGAVVSTRFSMW
jgi:hypothetical protein